MSKLKVSGFVTPEPDDCQGCTQLVDISVTVDLDAKPVDKKVSVKKELGSDGVTTIHHYIITD